MNANGGMSMSNNFVVKIGDSMEDFSNASMNRNIFEFLCDEAQLPNTQAASGTLKGRYTGEGEINYPHTRVFTEFQLGFQCDANMTPLKYLNTWCFKGSTISNIQGELRQYQYASSVVDAAYSQ